MSEKDQFYLDILDGLSVYFSSRFVADLVKTVAAHPEPDLAHALNHNQTASKTWLLEHLHASLGGAFDEVWVLGAWYGVLGAMLLDDARFEIGRLLSVDIEPACATVAESLNATPAASGRFEALSADMYDLDYAAGAPDLVINTSCEHLERFAEWYARIPPGTAVVLQSNDFFDCDYHVNCVPDLAALAAQAPMAERRFEGSLETKNYLRFMVIGRK